MSEKTKEEILKAEYDNARRLHPEQNWGEWDSEADSIAIGINAMQAYADQEKRSTAIAFAEWTSRKGYINYGDMWDLLDGENALSSDELYDIFTITP